MNSISPERLDQLLERARSVRVAVIGDLMLDVYLIGNVARISPEAPVPVVQVTEERAALGGAANVAANVVALGASSTLVGCVGEDAAALQLQGALADAAHRDITPHLLTCSSRPTTTKTRLMARRQQVARFDREEDRDLPAEAVQKLCELTSQVIRDADVLVLEDYNKGVLAPPVIQAALEAARQLRIPSVVDPKFRNFFAYQGATVFKPNLSELSAAFGMPLTAVDEAQIQETRHRLGCTYLLVTLGEAGMVLCSDAPPALRIPALAREVYDVSGAGDTVTACVAVAIGAGASVEEAAVLANLAAAIEVSKPGVATVKPLELRELVAGAARLEGVHITE